MIAQRWQAWAALALVVVGMIAWLVLPGGQRPDDGLEGFHREQQARTSLRLAMPDDPPPPPAPEEAPPPLVVIVTAADFQIDGESLTAEALSEEFRDAHDSDPGTLVTFKPAADASYPRLVDGMDRAKAAGLTKIAIGTDPADDSAVDDDGDDAP